MIKIGTTFAFCIFHLFCHTQASDVCTTVEPTTAQVSHVIDTFQELGRKLSYAQWEKNPSANIVLSSLSISIILNLLMAGTNGTTSTEIRNALNYANDLEECTIHKVFQNLLSSLEGASENEIEISLYTKLFPNEGFPILNSFISISNTYYFSEIQNLDYENSAELATDTINEWVSDSTNGKIPQIFPYPVNSDTSLIIVNVIFFNATWENKFFPGGTINGTFESESGNITIPMMTREMEVTYLNDSAEGLQIISLPYVGNRFSMYIIKPSDESSVTRLKEIENNINSAELNSLIDRMQSTLVSVTIPRMKLNSRLELKDGLQDLGINQIFGEGADFGRMTKVSNLAVNKIVHEAILEVAENGTVAVGVTYVVIGPVSAPVSEPPKFKLDKPSLIFIRDLKNNSTLFSAIVMNPEPI